MLRNQAGVSDAADRRSVSLPLLFRLLVGFSRCPGSAADAAAAAAAMRSGLPLSLPVLRASHGQSCNPGWIQVPILPALVGA